MKKYLSRPDILLLLMAGLMVAAGAMTDSDALIDLHFHDTYYVISIFHLAIVYAVLLVAEAGLYTATSRFRQWRGLQVFHLVSLLLPPLAFIISGSVQYKPYAGLPRNYFDYSSYSMLQSQFLPRLGFIVAFVFLAGHIAFLVNIVAGFVRGRRSRKSLRA